MPALTLLAHPDRRQIGEMVTLPELPAGRPVRLSRTAPALDPVGSAAIEPLGGNHLSRAPILLNPGAEAGALTVELGCCCTAVAADGRPLAEPRRLGPDDIERVVVFELAHRVVLLLPCSITVRMPCHGLIWESTSIVRLHQENGLVAGLDTPVLLLSDSGTGKELVAGAVHDAGPRRGQPASLAAKLFGARKGFCRHHRRMETRKREASSNSLACLMRLGRARKGNQIFCLGLSLRTEGYCWEKC